MRRPLASKQWDGRTSVVGERASSKWSTEKYYASPASPLYAVALLSSTIVWVRRADAERPEPWQPQAWLVRRARG